MNKDDMNAVLVWGLGYTDAALGKAINRYPNTAYAKDWLDGWRCWHEEHAERGPPYWITQARHTQRSELKQIV